MAERDVAQASERRQGPADPAERLHRLVLALLQGVMGLELAALVWRGQWLNAAAVAGVMALTLAPFILRDRLAVRMPYAFQILAVVFVFAALFLGEVQRFYLLFWWWDWFLHFGSGLLLGLLGFMLIYLLNADARVHLSTRPGFMALFAFCFALSFGTLWEIFEFAMDRLFGLHMQKPTPGDASGLADTMRDLMMDALGALIISLYGYAYMKRGARSFIARWIERFARENPDWFQRRPFRRG